MTRTPPPNTWRREPPQGWQEMERRAAAQAREFSRRGDRKSTRLNSSHE